MNENVPLAHSALASKEITIMIKNVSASWTSNAIVNTLHNINIKLETGKLYAIVGPVGAGKVCTATQMRKEILSKVCIFYLSFLLFAEFFPANNFRRTAAVARSSTREW